MVLNHFGCEIMAQSWEVRWKIYTLLVKVSKIRVVFGCFGGRTELYWAKKALQTMKNVIAVPHMPQTFWICEVLIYFCHFFWCSKKLRFSNFPIFFTLAGSCRSPWFDPIWWQIIFFFSFFIRTNDLWSNLRGCARPTTYKIHEFMKKLPNQFSDWYIFCLCWTPRVRT